MAESTDYPCVQIGTQVYLASEMLTYLRKGSTLKKHGRRGQPKSHHFKLSEDDLELQWGIGKNVKSVKLGTAQSIVLGQHSAVFKRNPEPESEHLSFSVYYDAGEKEARTLDLVCKHHQEFEMWVQGLRFVAGCQVKNSSTPEPIMLESRSMLEQGPSKGVPVMRGGGVGQVPGRVTAGVLGFPTKREIGDCYMWGTLLNNPYPEGSKDWEITKGMSAGPTPMIVGNTRKLDIHLAACGLQHACIVTRTGELYSWGVGDHGSLGHGSLQNVPYPSPVLSIYRSNSLGVTAVASCEHASVAVTEDAVFTWGTGLAGQLGHGVHQYRLCVPTPVAAFEGIKITQVAAGPFHMAAVCQEGRLFTWGDGLCGKLGHGDSEAGMTPKVVEGLAAQTVLSVSCGTWHTAALARPREKDSNSAVHLFTWGGICTWKEKQAAKSGTMSIKMDSHQGCLGHGDSLGRLLPTPVSFPDKPRISLKQVACGLNLTVVITSDGEVYQMGTTGGMPRPECPWEGAKEPTPVSLFALKNLKDVRPSPQDSAFQDPRLSLYAEQVVCGTHHVAVICSPITMKGILVDDRRRTRLVTWGRGSEGQLGTGYVQEDRLPEHRSQPQHVMAFSGRKILQVACGISHTVAVIEHDPVSAELAEAAEYDAARKAGKRSQLSPSTLTNLAPAASATSRVSEGFRRAATSTTDLSMVSTPSSQNSGGRVKGSRTAAAGGAGVFGKLRGNRGLSRRNSASSSVSSQSTERGSQQQSPLAAGQSQAWAGLDGGVSTSSSFTQAQGSVAPESPLHRTVSSSTPRSDAGARGAAPLSTAHEGLLRMQRMQDQMRQEGGAHQDVHLRLRSASEGQAVTVTRTLSRPPPITIGLSTSPGDSMEGLDTASSASSLPNPPPRSQSAPALEIPNPTPSSTPDTDTPPELSPNPSALPSEPLQRHPSHRRVLSAIMEPDHTSEPESPVSTTTANTPISPALRSQPPSEPSPTVHPEGPPTSPPVSHPPTDLLSPLPTISSAILEPSTSAPADPTSTPSAPPTPQPFHPTAISAARPPQHPSTSLSPTTSLSSSLPTTTSTTAQPATTTIATTPTAAATEAAPPARTRSSPRRSGFSAFEEEARKLDAFNEELTRRLKRANSSTSLRSTSPGRLSRTSSVDRASPPSLPTTTPNSSSDNPLPPLRASSESAKSDSAPAHRLSTDSTTSEAAEPTQPPQTAEPPQSKPTPQQPTAPNSQPPSIPTAASQQSHVPTAPIHIRTTAPQPPSEPSPPASQIQPVISPPSSMIHSEISASPPQLAAVAAADTSGSSAPDAAAAAAADATVGPPPPPVLTTQDSGVSDTSEGTVAPSGASSSSSSSTRTGSGGSEVNKRSVDRRPLQAVLYGETTVREADPGVYLILLRVRGGFELRRIRFNRRQFNHLDAQSWWPNNQARIIREYRIVGSARNPTGGDAAGSGAAVGSHPLSPAGRVSGGGDGAAGGAMPPVAEEHQEGV